MVKKKVDPIPPAEIDRTNEDSAYWEKILASYGLGVIRGSLREVQVGGPNDADDVAAARAVDLKWKRKLPKEAAESAEEDVY